MKGKSKLLGSVVSVGTVLVAGVASADTTAMTTAVTTEITAVEAAVGTILVAGLVITIALWSYGKIKQAIRRN